MMKFKKIISVSVLGTLLFSTVSYAQNSVTTKKGADDISSPSLRAASYNSVTAGLIAGNPYHSTSQGGKQADLNNLLVDDDTSLKMGSGVVVLVPAFSSVNFNYNNTIPGGTPYYIRLKETSDGLLSGLLGGAVGGFLNSSLIANHIIKTNIYSTTSSNNSFETFSTDNYWSQSNPTNFSVFYGGDGKAYLRVIPSSSYRRVEFEETNTGLLSGLLATSHSDIEYGYYYDNTNICDIPIFTSYTASGGLLSLLSSEPVTNAYRAVDNDVNSFSTIGVSSLLNINAGGSVEQIFHLPKLVDEKAIKFKLRVPSELLSLNIADQSSIVFYNGTEEVYVQKIDEGVLGLDLLGLVNNNSDIYTFTVTPRDENGNIIEFDKVGVRFVKPLSIDLISGANLEIYDIALVSTAVQVPVCTVNGKFNIKTIIPNYNASTTYIVTDVDQNEVDIDVPQPLGSYLIKGITSEFYCPTESVNFIAVQDNTYTITGKSSYGIEQGSSLTFDTSLYSTNLPTGSSIKFFNEVTGEEVTGNTITFNNLGSYNYYAQTINSAGTCEIIKKITVFVYDIGTCDYRYVLRHATNVTDWDTVSLLGIPLGAITDRAKAGDSDLSTHSTITNVVSLLGIGTTWQDLKFDSTIPAGTPLTIKLGQEYSLLQLIGAISLRPIDANGNAIGNLIGVGETDLLNALVGDNVFEFTFTPRDSDGDAIAYSGVRVHLGSVLGVGNSMNVFGAYIDERLPVTADNCEANIIVNGAATSDGLENTLTLNSSVADVMWGIEDIGIGAATALSGVVYPYLAADNDIETYAYVNQAASLLNAQTLTVKFKEIARPGDKVRIVLGKSSANVLNLNVLGDFTVQKYLGDVPVEDALTPADFSLIDLNLLGLFGENNNFKFAIIMNESSVPFDRVELRFTNIVNVELLGDYPKIYDVSLVPYLSFGSFDEGAQICIDKNIVLEKLDPCTEYALSFAYPTFDPQGVNIIGWNEIPGSSFIPNANDSNGDFVFTIPNTPGLMELYNNYASTTGLYIKATTTRLLCQYGDVQYLRVGEVVGCSSTTISNPMIRSRVNAN